MFSNSMMMAAQPPASSGSSDPLSIIGANDLLGWWRAFDDPGTAGQLTDKSGNSHHLLQPTSTKEFSMLAAAINGHDAWKADGIDDFYKASFTVAATRELWAIIRKRKDSGWQNVFDGGSISSQLVYNYNGDTYLSMYAGALLRVSSSQPTSFLYHRLLFNGASSEMAQNGVLIASGDTGSSLSGGLTVGSSSNGTQPSHYDYADFWLINRATTTAEQTSLNSYITATYAL